MKVPKYLEDTHLYELKIHVISRQNDLYEFSDSIFHIQGGGQPNDKGCIRKDNLQFSILGAINNRETGRYKIEAELKVGDQVTMCIDPSVRRIHAKIHSAGHLIDLAVMQLKYPWKTTKGYHFIDGPFVEYQGPVEDKQRVTQQINKQLQIILKSQIKTQITIYSYQKAVQLKIIPQQFKTSFVRIVNFNGSQCPCGGTHIKNTNQIQSLVVKVNKKGKNVKINYIVQ